MGGDQSFEPRHRLLLFSIAKGLTRNPDIYDATRFAWRIDKARAEEVELVLGCVDGVVKGVYVPDRPWMEATPENFPGLVAIHTGLRWGFKGVKADEATGANYIEKRVPDSLTIGQCGFRYFDDRALYSDAPSSELLESLPAAEGGI